MSLRSTFKAAKKTVSKVLTPTPGASDETDVLDTLKREHDEVKSLLGDLNDATTSAERRALVQQIKAALIPHTKAEEKVVYGAVIALRNKDAQMDGHEGYLEHEWASMTLLRLDRLQSATSPEHKATAKVLKELVEHHIREEENNIWKVVKDNFSEEDRIRMNVAFERAKARVRVK
jgi:hemerythrin-like domain-containing protein